MGHPSFRNGWKNKYGKDTPEQSQGEVSVLSDEDVKKILDLNENYIENFVKKAQECAEEFKVSESQIRKFYAYVKEIERDSDKDNNTFDKVKLYLLIPKIAYSAKRNNVTPKFQKTFEKLIKEIKTKEDFDKFVNFVKFFEAIIAYSKKTEK